MRGFGLSPIFKEKKMAKKTEKVECKTTPDGVLIRGPEGNLTREYRVKHPEEARKLDEKDG